MKYKPLLAPNKQIDLSSLQYPVYASTKLDGIRCIIHPELGIASRSLKPIPNKQINEKLQHLVTIAKREKCVLDGELFSEELTFQEITSHVMTQDKECPEHLLFHAFDCIYNEYNEEMFFKRYERLRQLNNYTNIGIKVLMQRVINNKEELQYLYERNLDDGFEGLMVRSKHGKYKYGRATERENIIYKVKPYKDFECVIKDVVQATKVDPNAEKKTNELGNSVTSKKKDDRILIDKACAFLVDYEGMDLKVNIAATDEEKEQIWKNRDIYPGTIVKFKGMLVGAKDLPRHPVAEEWLNHKREV